MTSLTTSGLILGGCIRDHRTEPTASQIDTPTLVAEDWRPDDPVTTFRVRWHGQSVDAFDITTNDGKIHQAPEGEENLILALGVENTGSQSHRFVPDTIEIIVNAQSHEHQFIESAARTFGVNGIQLQPADTISGWLGYSIPKNVTEARIVARPGGSDPELDVTYEYVEDRSLSFPFE
ncbi:DUF4352 domain-containing protein [Halocatena marina]|uniref:DUF4352 domain-containing protein n=1 Tax=Halocatena marina TaxID=2934937 RepID=A0ABD5YVG9_9EURY|nr:DUF4352 domain-containing protein [Halocatena marina]